MRIAFALGSFDDSASNAEMTALYFDWARLAARQGHEVLLLTLSDQGDSVEVREGVQIVRKHFNAHRFAGLEKLGIVPVTTWFLTRSAELFRLSIEVFAAFRPDMLQFVKATDSLFFSSQGLCPVVIQSVSPQFAMMQLNLDGQYSRLDTSLVNTLEVAGYGLADAITTPSLTLASMISEGTGVPLDSMSIIKSPVDIVAADLAKPEPLSHEPFPKIFHSAGVERLKGVEFLVDALPAIHQTFPDFHLTIAGEEPILIGEESPYSQVLKERLKDMGLDGHVQFLGVQPRARIHELIERSDIFAFPLLYCGCPYGCQEAMVRGTPVLATRAGAIPEFVEHGKTGWLVEPGNASAIAEAIVKLSNDPDLRAKLSIRARQSMREMCSPETLAGQMSAVYDGVLRRFQSRNDEDRGWKVRTVELLLGSLAELSDGPALANLLDAKYKEGLQAGQQATPNRSTIASRTKAMLARAMKNR